jgi:hypothetical protein
MATYKRSNLLRLTNYLYAAQDRILIDSAKLQSTQRIINAAYNQRSLQSMPLYTA